MAFPSPRSVRWSSSKSLRTSLTSFPRPFCSSHLFRLCNLPLPPLILPSPAVGRFTPEVTPLNRSVQIQSRVQWILSSSSSSLSSSFVRGLSNLGFGTSTGTATRMACQVSSTYPTLSCDSARCREVQSNMPDERKSSIKSWNYCLELKE